MHFYHFARSFWLGIVLPPRGRHPCQKLSRSDDAVGSAARKSNLTFLVGGTHILVPYYGSRVTFPFFQPNPNATTMTALTIDQPRPQHQRRRSSHESILSGLFSEAASVASGRFLGGGANTPTAVGGQGSLGSLLSLCAQEDGPAEEHFVVRAVRNTTNNNNSSACAQNDEDDELSLDLGADADADASEPNVADSKGANGPSSSGRAPHSSSNENDTTIQQDDSNSTATTTGTRSTGQSPSVDAEGATPSESNFADDCGEEEPVFLGQEGTAPLARPPTSTDARSGEQQAAFDQQRRRNQRNEHYVACADDFLFDDDDDDDDDSLSDSDDEEI